MPEHVHLLLSEPETKPLSTAIQVLKQRFSRTRPEPEVWETRYYDFNIYTAARLPGKLSYMHLNPVRRGLVREPQHWRWSSYQDNDTNEPLDLRPSISQHAVSADNHPQ